MFFTDNFADARFDYSTLENTNFDIDDYPLEATNGESSTSATQAGRLELDPTLTGLNMDEIEDWWLAPRSDGATAQYTGSTLLDYPYDEFAGVYGSQASPVSGTDTNKSYGFGVLEQQPTYEPEHTGLSVAGHLPSHLQATFAGPIATPSPTPTLSWDPSQFPSTSYTAARNDWPGIYDQPLTERNFGGQRPYPTSVGKGKARATDHFRLPHPPFTGDTMRHHQMSYAPQHCDAGSNPQMGISVSNIGLPTQAAPSIGPQRSVRSAKGKGKATDMGKGKWKHIPKKALPPDINWPNTCARFCAEMAKICFDQPTGEPLVAKPLGGRSSRELEQYLTKILNQLRPGKDGQKKGVKYMLERVARELENELVVLNDDFALQDGHSNEIDPEELNTSDRAAKQRLRERARRDSVRRNLEQMTLFFKLPVPGYLWSRPQVLFFAITYLVFGVGVFSDAGGFFTPKP